MIDALIPGIIQRIHESPTKVCFVVTGAGTSAICALFSVAGASRTVIEAQIPYAQSALDGYVGFVAEQHVSRGEAEVMSRRAYARALQLSGLQDQDETGSLVGLSCTAAIATDRERRGENRAHIAWHNGSRGATYSIVMNKGSRDRAGEEALCAAIIINALAEACGIEERLELDLVEGEIVERFSH